MGNLLKLGFIFLLVSGFLGLLTLTTIQPELNLLESGVGLSNHKWNTNEITYSIENIPDNLSDEEVRIVVAFVFDEWEEISDFEFSEVPEDGSIKISWELGDHGDGHAFSDDSQEVAHAFQPTSGGLLPRDGDIHLSANHVWCASLTSCAYIDIIDLRQVLIHEIGHSLGLGHSDNPEDIMWPYYGERTDFSVGDILALRVLYKN